VEEWDAATVAGLAERVDPTSIMGLGRSGSCARAEFPAARRAKTASPKTFVCGRMDFSTE
jgi:hypothetical protein